MWQCRLWTDEAHLQTPAEGLDQGVAVQHDAGAHLQEPRSHQKLVAAKGATCAEGFGVTSPQPQRPCNEPGSTLRWRSTLSPTSLAYRVNSELLMPLAQPAQPHTLSVREAKLLDS